MKINRKILCCGAILLAATVFAEVLLLARHAKVNYQYIHKRGSLLLISESLTRYVNDFQRFPLVRKHPLIEGHDVSWRVAIAPYCQEVSQKYTSRESDSRFPQPLRGWPFTDGSSSSTNILAVIQPGGPWLPAELDLKTHTAKFSPNEVIAICCDDFRVEWDSFSDAYWDGTELSIDTHEKLFRVRTLQKCFVLRYNGVVEYYPDTTPVSTILDVK